MGNIKSTILATPYGQEKYDAICKELLGNRQIISRVLKRFAREYETCSVEEIENLYIEPESILISGEAVERNRTNQDITGMNTEDKTINEGTVYYDVMFHACYPDHTGKRIGLIINVEAQNDYYPGYELETRGIYYAARKLSSELKAINRNTNYGNLEKVYSIWICMGEHVPDKEANTVSLYEMGKNDIIGNVERSQESYDLLSVIIVRVGNKADAEDPILAMLQLLFSIKVSKEEKIEGLKKIGIRMDDEIMEGARVMGSLGQGLVESTRRQVTQEVTKQIAIKMYRKNIPLEEIADVADVSVDVIRTWLEEETLSLN